MLGTDSGRHLCGRRSAGRPLRGRGHHWLAADLLMLVLCRVSTELEQHHKSCRQTNEADDLDALFWAGLRRFCPCLALVSEFVHCGLCTRSRTLGHESALGLGGTPTQGPGLFHSRHTAHGSRGNHKSHDGVLGLTIDWPVRAVRSDISVESL